MTPTDRRCRCAVAEIARPPQWLFDEITKLPPEARGWALGFMCAGWLAGRESVLETSVRNFGGTRYMQCGTCGCIVPTGVKADNPRCVHVHDGKTCGGIYTTVPPVGTPRVE